MSRLELVVTAGDAAGKKLEIESELVIGRGEGTDLTLDDPEVSRRHAAIRPLGPGAEIEDLGSTNGTFVNGRRLDDPASIGPGDEIRIGQTTLSIETDVRSAETMTEGSQPAPSASTTPIRIDSGNVPRWEPAANRGEPRLARQPLRSSTDELSVGRGQSILDRLPPLPIRWIAAGAIVLVVAIILFRVVFGGGGTVSKKDFVAAADKICHSTSVKARDFDPGSARTPGALSRASSHLVKVRKAGLAKIKRLDQPKGTKKLKHFYRAAGNTTRAVKRLGAAAHVGNKKRRNNAIHSARSRLRKAQTKEKKAAKAYKLDKCGSLIGV